MSTSCIVELEWSIQVYLKEILKNCKSKSFEQKCATTAVALLCYLGHCAISKKSLRLRKDNYRGTGAVMKEMGSH